MYRYQITLLLCLAWWFSASAADKYFPCSTISAVMMENSNAVIRYHETNLKILSAGKAVMNVNYALTILNENAVEDAILMLGYGKFMTIRHLQGNVYDKAGDRVEKIENKQFVDASAISGFSTYEDSREIICKPKYQTVPFTVQYSFEIDYNGILDYPDFYLVSDFNVSVEKAGLHVSVPDSLGLSYLEQNIPSSCIPSNANSVITYSWNFTNIPSLHREIFSLPIARITPSVLLAPRSFEMKRKWGHNDSWKNFGLWFYQLIKDRGELSDETQHKVIQMTAGIGDTLKKIQVLYQYLQDKTRYASIQVGIGGWQPAKASEVDRLGYGDCKALTNYMQALLKTAGIDSYYTLVDAGEDEPNIIRIFPSNQFNHAMLCVPLKSDSLWLECTSQSLPLGYQSTFTDDRSVLVIRENGGFIANTPVYDQYVNSQCKVSHVQLQEDGSASMLVKIINKGLYYDQSSKILLSDDGDRKRKITEKISVANFSLDNFELKEQKSTLPQIEETLNLTIKKITVQAGDLVLFVPNQLTREEGLPNLTIQRKNPIYVRRSTLQTDTNYYSIPAGLTFTGNQLNETIVSNFGEYHAVSSLQGQTIRYIRYLVIYKGTYPPESYEDFIGFFEKVAYTDSKKLALKF